MILRRCEQIRNCDAAGEFHEAKFQSCSSASDGPRDPWTPLLFTQNDCYE